MTGNEILEKVRMIKDYKQTIKQFEEELKSAENELKEMMDKNGVEEYCIDVFTLHYVPVKTERFDSKAFREAHPEMYGHYCKTSESKRFSIT